MAMPEKDQNCGRCWCGAPATGERLRPWWASGGEQNQQEALAGLLLALADAEWQRGGS